MSKTIIIIGAGLAGLSAALQAAENGCNVKLVSSLPSERAQSVMAGGGINAALNTKDENDSPEEHFTDTIKAACGLADPNAVWGMTQAAPELVHWLLKLGVKFNMSGYDDVEKKFAVDVFAKDHGFVITDRKLAKEISADILAGEPVGVFSDFGFSAWKKIPEGLFEDRICKRNL